MLASLRHFRGGGNPGLCFLFGWIPHSTAGMIEEGWEGREPAGERGVGAQDLYLGDEDGISFADLLLHDHQRERLKCLCLISTT